MTQHGEDEVRPPMPVIRDVLYDDVALYGPGYVFPLYLAVFELESFVLFFGHWKALYLILLV